MTHQLIMIECCCWGKPFWESYLLALLGDESKARHLRVQLPAVVFEDENLDKVKVLKHEIEHRWGWAIRLVIKEGEPETVKIIDREETQ